MLHAREDYNRRIQDSENIIPAKEPVFLLRGQDRLASGLLLMYADAVEDAEGDPVIVHNTRLHAQAMLKWQKEVKSCLPDMDAADSLYAAEEESS